MHPCEGQATRSQPSLSVSLSLGDVCVHKVPYVYGTTVGIDQIHRVYGTFSSKRYPEFTKPWDFKPLLCLGKKKTTTS